MKDSCPCHSGKNYEDCCQRYHLGTALPEPEALMRSRYSAYALGLVDYILATTHPEHPLWQEEKEKTRKSIAGFGQNTIFEGLMILENLPVSDKESYVTFKAILKQDGRAASFTEKSLFIKENGRWLYASGKIA